MKSKTTGIIIRKMTQKSTIRIEGFQWKHGVRYIVLNKHLTGDLAVIAGLLPRTKSGFKVGMQNKYVKARKETIEENWIFLQRSPNERKMREIAARVGEI